VNFLETAFLWAPDTRPFLLGSLDKKCVSVNLLTSNLKMEAAYAFETAAALPTSTRFRGSGKE
jgi:hypothetical protein